MAEASLHTLSSTLGTQTSVSSDPSLQPGGNEVLQASPISDANAAPISGASNSELPVKRRPGRPKGSGKKPVDPNAEPKIKRPVGRPRKDGLPAGSIGPRRPARPRKRPPGTFASGSHPPTQAYPYATASFSSFTSGQHTAWPNSISAPPMGSISRGPQQGSNFAFQIDPSLDRDNWAELSRTRPDAFLQTLVSGLAAPNPVSGAGPSVEEAFKSHLVSLAPNTKSTPSIPSLYSILKTFWLPSSPVYFSLTASASTARTPSEYRFLYWDPQPLVFNGIACPACSAPLINRGRISSGPIKIYDLGKPFFIIGCEYICKSAHCIAMTSLEGRKFASTDSSILRALPAKLKDEFPALLMQGTADLGSGSDIWNWHGMGVSLALWNMVKASLRAGLTKEAIMDIIAAIQLGVVEDVFDRGRNDNVEEEEEDHEMEEVEGDLNSTDEFNDAWNANSGIVSANHPSELAQTGPSTSVQPSLRPPPPPLPPPPIQSATPSPNQEAVHHDPPASMVSAPAPAVYPTTPYSQGPYVAYQYPYPYYTPQQPTPTEMHIHNGTQNGVKRTFSIVDSSPDPSLSEPLQKRIRHCSKCGSTDCKGKGGRSFCTHPCQDCGKLECKGRNSKRPDRTCTDAWP